MGAWPPGWGRIILDEVDSTSAVLMRDPTPAPVWCLAHRQTGGRGRRGRPWAFAAGNFAASLKVSPPIPLAAFSQYSFVMALALFDALEPAVDRRERLRLKWPNDVLLDGKKVSGILLETAPGRPQPDLIIGVGVNLVHAPEAHEVEPGAVTPGSILKLTATRLEPLEFLNDLAAAFAERAARFEREGFAGIREAWLDRAQGLGKPVKARLPNVTHDGIFETIDDTGALILQTDDGPLVLPAADVYFSDN